ncbi:MAG: aldehyde ferredoxin oxidoreductase family protein [Methanomicrobiales archaeon]|nr:aldehyde ferredoxin oxidoreductase family protein [Methanomicrobiales archaeon]MDI6875868.1 aldehyde ferredoxin oxidoreductase family protein [Methanomicrobiales archaeon]
MDGYTGKILDVDLSTGSIRTESYPEAWSRDYIGGRGFGVRILLERLDPHVDPLTAGNLLVLAAGPLTGSGLPLCSRYDIVTKSPLTGTITSANSGGSFGVELKRAGFDAIVIRGRAERAVYLQVRDGAAALRDAAPYWGRGTGETAAGIQQELRDPRAKIACIGPAGERLSRIACIVNENARAAGRGGVGAVMGSKRLKAVAVRGSGKYPVSDPEALRLTRERILEKLKRSGITGGSLRRYGTAGSVNLVNELCLLPTRNFQGSHFPQAGQVSGEEMAETILERVKGCYSCPVACGRVTRVDGALGEGPEYETIWSFGPDCGVGSLRWIAIANNLCNDLGLDTISTGATIACAMELSERGYLNEEIRFGDGRAVADLVRMIGYREGIGDELAEGSLRFAARYGHPEFSMSVKGQEMPGYDPRGMQGQGLAYATSVRGACHVYGNMLYPEVLGIPVRLDPLSDAGKAWWVKRFQDLFAAIDASGACLFSIRSLDPDDYAAMLSAAVGRPVDAEEFLRSGERIWNLQRIFNLAAGFSKADDTLPERMLEEPLTCGAAAGCVWRREPLLTEYYRERGWTEDGIPTAEKLRELGIG